MPSTYAQLGFWREVRGFQSPLCLSLQDSAGFLGDRLPQGEDATDCDTDLNFNVRILKFGGPRIAQIPSSLTSWSLCFFFYRM